MRLYGKTEAMQAAAAATGNGTQLDVSGFASLGMQITGTFVGTVTFEATVDNATWVSLQVTNVADGSISTTATAPGIFVAPVAGLQHVRARVSAWTSGTITVTGRKSTAAGAGNLGDVDLVGSEQVQGMAAEDAAAAGNPLLSGGRYDVAARTLDDGDVGAVAIAADGAVHVDDGGNALSIDIGGVAPQLDDTDKVAVSLYGFGAAAGDSPLEVESVANPNLLVRLAEGTSAISTRADDADARGVINSGFHNHARQFLFNGTNYDRQRNNAILALLASAARTATATSPTQTNYNWRGFVLSVDVTAQAVGTTLTPGLQIQATGGDWKTIWTAAAAINTANASYVYLFYPGVIASGAALFVEELDLTFGRTWRVVITHNDANSITYSCGAEMIL